MRALSKREKAPVSRIKLVFMNDITDIPAYSDTVYSDTPPTVTVLTDPNWPFLYKKDVVTVTPRLQ